MSCSSDSRDVFLGWSEISRLSLCTPLPQPPVCFSRQSSGHSVNELECGRSLLRVRVCSAWTLSRCCVVDFSRGERMLAFFTQRANSSDLHYPWSRNSSQCGRSHWQRECSSTNSRSRHRSIHQLLKESKTSREFISLKRWFLDAYCC